MKRALLALVLLAMAASAAAAEELTGAYRIEAPAGFEPMPSLAEKLATTAEQSQPLGAVEVDAGAQAWARAGHGALYVSWVAAREPATEPEAVIRAAFDRVREAPVAASPQAGSTQETAYRESVAAGLAEAALEWQHLSNETVTLTRALAWASPEGAVRLVKAECVYASADAAVRPACQQALASLAVEVDAEQRRELAALGPSRAPAPTSLGAELAATDDEAGASGPSMRPPPAAGDRVLYRGQGQQADRSALTWIVLGGALLAVGAWLYLRGRRGAGSDADDEGAAQDRGSAGVAGDDAKDRDPEADEANDRDPEADN